MWIIRHNCGRTTYNTLNTNVLRTDYLHLNTKEISLVTVSAQVETTQKLMWKHFK